jgi:hypothetical protein
MARPTTGVAADGKVSPAQHSTSFKTSADQLACMMEARKVIAERYEINLEQPPEKQKQAVKPSYLGEIVDHKRLIGSGFSGELGTATPLKSPKSGKVIGEVYGAVKPVPGIEKSYNDLKWDGHRWMIARHFPAAEE